mmetsp:Transcript_18813/g.17033  ORF Transcript_18813/g.17033 Transcript_18813/m.17033 type:complete len:86 (+) Transcript_18813:75-332(+)
MVVEVEYDVELVVRYIDRHILNKLFRLSGRKFIVKVVHSFFSMIAVTLTDGSWSGKYVNKQPIDYIRKNVSCYKFFLRSKCNGVC